MPPRFPVCAVLFPLAAVSLLGAPPAARAGDVLVPEDAIVSAARRLDESSVALRVTRSRTEPWMARWTQSPNAYRLDTFGTRIWHLPGEPPVTAPVSPPPDATTAAKAAKGAAAEAEAAATKARADYERAAKVVGLAEVQGRIRLLGSTATFRGFFVGDGKAILTAAAAVEGASRVEVVRPEGVVEAVVVGLDRDFDVALLRSPASGPPLELDASTPLEPGRVVLVGGAGASGTGIDVGLVSSLWTESPRRGYGELSGPLPAAALGGPALGPDGRVRGIVVGTSGLSPHAATAESCSACHAISRDTSGRISGAFTNGAEYLTNGSDLPTLRLLARRAGTAAGAQAEWTWPQSSAGGSGAFEPFAYLVPARRLARALPEMLATGKVRKAYLGLVLGVPEGEGKPIDERRVARLLPGSPCEGSVKAGDRIVAIGGRALSRSDDLSYEILALEPGKPAGMVVERAGDDGKPAEVRLQVVPAERKDDASATGPRVFGFEAVPLTAELRAWLGTDEDGLVISLVAPGGAAERAGARRGDRVQRLAGRDVKTPADLAAAADDALRRLAAGEAVVLEVVRDGKAASLPLLAK